MGGAEAILDLGERKINLYGNWITCDKTSSGLYTIGLGKTEEALPIQKLFAVLEEKSENKKHKRNKLRKLHRQFGHLSETRFRDLLKTAGKWKNEYSQIVSDLYEISVKLVKYLLKYLRDLWLLYQLLRNSQKFLQWVSKSVIIQLNINTFFI